MGDPDPTQERAAVLTPVDHTALRASLALAWSAFYGEDAPACALDLLLAQSALETGRWASAWNWNLGGIKSDGTGPHFYRATLEVLKRADGERSVSRSTVVEPCELARDEGGLTLTVRFLPRHPVCRFRAYDSLDQAAAGYLGLLARRYPAALDAASRDDAEAFVHELRHGGYFTADPSAYLAGVQRLLVDYADPALSSPAEVAAALASLGYADVRAFQAASMSPADVDGIAGPRTKAAIRAALSAAG